MEIWVFGKMKMVNRGEYKNKRKLKVNNKIVGNN